MTVIFNELVADRRGTHRVAPTVVVALAVDVDVAVADNASLTVWRTRTHATTT
jgi:hypothetical protein